MQFSLIIAASITFLQSCLAAPTQPSPFASNIAYNPYTRLTFPISGQSVPINQLTGGPNGGAVFPSSGYPGGAVFPSSGYPGSTFGPFGFGPVNGYQTWNDQSYDYNRQSNSGSTWSPFGQASFNNDAFSSASSSNQGTIQFK